MSTMTARTNALVTLLTAAIATMDICYLRKQVSVKTQECEDAFAAKH